MNPGTKDPPLKPARTWSADILVRTNPRTQASHADRNVRAPLPQRLMVLDKPSLTGRTVSPWIWTGFARPGRPTESRPGLGTARPVELCEDRHYHGRQWLYWFACGLLLLLASSEVVLARLDRELIRDPHFQNGFYLRAPAPGKRVVYGTLQTRDRAKPVWDLAQWSSRFPLEAGPGTATSQILEWTNPAKAVVLGMPGSSAADLCRMRVAALRQDSC